MLSQQFWEDLFLTSSLALLIYLIYCLSVLKAVLMCWQGTIYEFLINSGTQKRSYYDQDLHEPGATVVGLKSERFLYKIWSTLFFQKKLFNEHVLNKYALRTKFFRDQWGWGIKGGWSRRKCLAMRTIMAAKFTLRKRSSTNSTLSHSILSSQCHRRTYGIVSQWMIFSNFFFAELRCYTIV